MMTYAIQVKVDGHWIFLATDDDDGNIMVRTLTHAKMPRLC